MHKILVALRVIPIGTSSTSISEYIARVVSVLERKKIKYQLTPFNTSLEIYRLEDLTDIINEIIKALSDIGVKRIAIDIQLDVRLDKEITLEYKVDSVLRKIRVHG